MILIVIFILLLFTCFLLLLYTVNSSWNDTNVVDLIVDLREGIRMQRSITITFSSNRIKTKNGSLIFIEYLSNINQFIYSASEAFVTQN